MTDLNQTQNQAPGFFSRRGLKFFFLITLPALFLPPVVWVVGHVLAARYNGSHYDWMSDLKFGLAVSVFLLLICFTDWSPLWRRLHRRS
ncbi:hypothetical protein ACUDCK_29780 (plasmid) [Achromobacter sp. CF-sbj1-Ac2-l]|jgi:hypothetical protein|uniref:hypothetical protein n=1 Tax=Achromobacter TaxID=222 RepID=UPI0006C03160|nr:hypothetical protein [Achromobacter xylosoxidans]CUJ64171.1 Uncharacterised protein [Achromobacter xylosoxidans]